MTINDQVDEMMPMFLAALMRRLKASNITLTTEDFNGVHDEYAGLSLDVNSKGELRIEMITPDADYEDSLTKSLVILNAKQAGNLEQAIMARLRKRTAGIQ